MFFETLKANFLILIFFVAIIAVGYWAIKSLQVSPEEFDTTENDIRPVIVNEPTGYVPGEEVSLPTTTEAEVPAPTSEAPVVTPSSGLHDELKADLQKLVTDNVIMKKGSRGTRVGTVQEFLNIYNGTDSKIDNDFGGTTENQVKSFQKAQGLSADGQTGPGTYKKMIEWLDKQN